MNEWWLVYLAIGAAVGFLAGAFGAALMYATATRMLVTLW